jgi:hypothetical protein
MLEKAAGAILPPFSWCEKRPAVKAIATASAVCGRERHHFEPSLQFSARLRFQAKSHIRPQSLGGRRPANLSSIQPRVAAALSLALVA